MKQSTNRNLYRDLYNKIQLTAWQKMKHQNNTHHPAVNFQRQLGNTISPVSPGFLQETINPIFLYAIIQHLLDLQCTAAQKIPEITRISYSWVGQEMALQWPVTFLSPYKEGEKMAASVWLARKAECVPVSLRDSQVPFSITAEQVTKLCACVYAGRILVLTWTFLKESYFWRDNCG